ncbi:MAG: hypothetical protein AAFR74_01940 [Pseudomonadota bacterium]
MKTLALSAAILAATLMANAEQQAPAPRAVECVSVFEIMRRAAPNWMKQTRVQAAKQAWQIDAQNLSRKAEVDFGTQINREMTRLADISAQSPDTLSKLALNCFAEADL